MRLTAYTDYALRVLIRLALPAGTPHDDCGYRKGL